MLDTIRQDYRYQDGQHSNKYLWLGASHPLEWCHHPLWRWDKIVHGRTDSKNLSGQVLLPEIDLVNLG
jgi:hypothetical protein